MCSADLDFIVINGFLDKTVFGAMILFLVSTFVFAQNGKEVSPADARSTANRPASQEISDLEGLPVLLLHLPDWEKARSQAAFARSREELRVAVGDRPIIEQIDFSGGTEAVAAPYPSGKLLIVEYMTPQASAFADEVFRTALVSENGATVYRRIGNYNVFVFDAWDRDAAEKLLNEVKYEKSIQWLGDNPFELSAERIFVLVYSNVFIATVLIIVIGVGVAVIGGSIAGFLFFRFRQKAAMSRPTFTDAGGMTRLNLDGFTPEIIPEPHLKD